MGLWEGSYQNQSQCWLRWWDSEGNLLPIGDERAEQERQRAESERKEKEIAQAQLRECALNLLREGMELEKVARMTGLEIESIAAIADNG